MIHAERDTAVSSTRLFDGGCSGGTINGNVGNAGNNTLWIGPGDNTLRGGGGNDTLSGNAGDDLAYGGPGDDTLNGFA